VMNGPKSSLTVGACRAALRSALGSLPLRTPASQSWAMVRPARREFAELADGRLAALAVVGDVGDHEGLASGWGDLSKNPGSCVAKFV